MSENCCNSDTAYDDVEAFRGAVTKYLEDERRYVEQDISEHEAMSPEEKERLGLLIRNALLLNDEDRTSIIYETPVNFTKLRPGDEVLIRDVGSSDRSFKAIVDENAIERIALTLKSSTLPLVDMPTRAEIRIDEQNNLDTLLSVVRNIVDGSRGVNFMKMLGGLSSPREEGRFGSIRDFCDSEMPVSFNEEQRRAVRMAMLRPSLSFVQGTPGSGKTHLLAVVARAYARRAKDVLVVALTHQAVNNALNKVCEIDRGIPVVKIGKQFKNIGLNDSVAQDETFSGYIERRKKEGFFGNEGHVVGMTFQSALVNLGMRRSAFTPQIVLFDEAGQVPLAHAVAVGEFGCGSVIFIGDDAQMPPIYHARLEKDPLSMSVFERIKQLFPKNGRVLNVTYRMNREITRFVGDCFYRPRGIELVCSEYSSERRIDDPVIEFITCSSVGSTDENLVEARKAVDVANRYIDAGLPIDRIAIITPYRRQVRMIHKLFGESKLDSKNCPLVDTVERLQGQDVDVIILSFAVDDEVYFAEQRAFLMNHNRLNVMFSRATSKVVVVSSQLVKEEMAMIVSRARNNLKR